MPWRQAHEALCRTSSIIGSAMVDLRAVRDDSLPPAGYASEERSRAAAFVKILQFPRQRRFCSNGRFSPRAASMRNARVFACAFPRVLTAGLVLPHASPTDFRRSGSKSASAHVMPLGISMCRVPFARLVSPSSARPSRKLVVMLSRPKIRSPKGSARTLSFNRSDRGDFRSRKLQETRPRCRLTGLHTEPRTTR